MYKRQGHNAYVAGYRIGGKTGTSTKTTKEISGEKEYIVSFIGFAQMCIRNSGIIVCESRREKTLHELKAPISRVLDRVYGKIKITVYKKET